MLWKWIWIIQTLISHEKTVALFRYYILAYKIEVSKHCVVPQSVFFVGYYQSK